MNGTIFRKNAIFRKIMSEIDRYDEFSGCFFGKSCFFISFFEKYSIFFWEMRFFVRFCRVEYLSLCAERMPSVTRAEVYGFYGIPSS